LTLTAILGEETIAVDKVEIWEAAARERFEGQVCNDRPGIPRDDVRRQLMKLATDHMDRKSGEQPAASKADDVTLPDGWMPFPVDQFPPVVGEYLIEAGKAQQVDTAFVALPMLAAMGAAIGNTTLALVKSGFTQPATLWTSIVAPSGDGKSPGQNEALRHTRNAQLKLVKQFNDALDIFNPDKAEYDAKSKADRATATMPVAPAMSHVIISDATCEAIAMRLYASLRGLLSAVDELAGLFKSFNSYKKTGNDEQTWLGFYDAGYVKIDRKVGPTPTVIIQHAFVSLCGGIQPGVLANIFNDENFDAGLPARFLFAAPPSRCKTWNEDTISDEANAAIDDVFCKLFAIQLPFDAISHQVKPRVLPLTDEARRIWGDWFNEVEQERYNGDETPYVTCLPKVRSAAVRIALILQLVSYATGETTYDNKIEALNMQRGVELARWFKREQARVYAGLHLSKAHRKVLRLIGIIRNDLGGMVSIRKWHRKRSHKSAEAAEKELQGIVDAKMGRWQFIRTSKVGQQAKTLVLSDTSPDDAIKKASEVSQSTRDIKSDFSSSQNNFTEGDSDLSTTSASDTDTFAGFDPDSDGTVNLDPLNPSEDDEREAIRAEGMR